MSIPDLSALSGDELDRVLNGPALEPPEGVTPDFVSHSGMNHVGYTIYTIFAVLGLSASLLRLGVRRHELKRFNIIEILLLLSLVFYIVFIALGYQRLTVGRGQFLHQWDIPMWAMQYILYNNLIGMNIYSAGIGLIKTAVILEWLRIFAPTRERNFFWWASHIILWINIIFYSFVLIAVNLSCLPHRRIWDRTVPGRCIDIVNLELTTAVVNLTLDLITLLIPQKVIWKLQMSRQKKIGVSVVFAVGLLGVAAAAARVVATARYMISDDRVWWFPSIAHAALGEMTCGILVLCVPLAPKAFAGLKASGIFKRMRGLSVSAPSASESAAHIRNPSSTQSSDTDERSVKWAKFPTQPSLQQPASILHTTRISTIDGPRKSEGIDDIWV
ncbi:hypothetical protein S7711_07033 [Stachybotrys chartarum IBT 7711]|uniref:Rhodopsin domain-containing protein n=1 Tax=Stachybotrys chartarum (strain CBS 109288 / IBT 7711) TaxID=1280523 RepID=A0A084ASK2_STACB|nr:hypothetical protein S7711_07033 [Stachybotrys chartarum IBT 7711]KFA80633.1 hypothetical protein S40288_07539 [Stachybotrys chartarum IBT 40288]